MVKFPAQKRHVRGKIIKVALLHISLANARALVSLLIHKL